MMNKVGGKKRGVTLVEVMVTSVLIALVGISIIAGSIYGAYSQQAIHESNGAMRLAGEILDQQKRRLFSTLEPMTLTAEEARDEGYIIYDNASPDNPNDDTIGSIELKFFNAAGMEVGNGVNDIPKNARVRARVVITWDTAGRGSKQRTVVLSTIISP